MSKDDIVRSRLRMFLFELGVIDNDLLTEWDKLLKYFNLEKDTNGEAILVQRSHPRISLALLFPSSYE